MATILYGRVSTIEQTADHQLTQAKAAGFKINEAVFDNGTSGVSTRLVERPEGRRLFDKLRAGDVLVVRWVDRLGRNYDDVVETIREFMRRGVVIKTVINGMTFNSATKDPVQKAVRDALIAFMAATAQAQAGATKAAQPPESSTRSKPTSAPTSAASQASHERGSWKSADNSDKAVCLHRSPGTLGLAGKRSIASRMIQPPAKPRSRLGGCEPNARIPRLADALNRLGHSELRLMHCPVSNDLRQYALSCKRRRLQMARNREKSNHYDPWYAKFAFGLFLCVLVGSLVALYSGVPVVQFVTRGL